MRRHNRIFVALLLTALAASSGGGCTGVGIERTSHAGFGDAVRISNSHVELFVVPSTGRIMHYGFLGERNVLWTNVAAPTTRDDDAWQNFGGDKVWIWPQNGWRAVTGRAWPPPGDPPTEPYRVEPIARGVRLTSPPIAKYGVRIVRDIRLPSDGTRVEITSWLEPVAGAAHVDEPIAVWSVTQVPATDGIFAASATEARIYPMDPFAPLEIARTDGLTLRLQRRRDVASKVGLDSTVLAAEYDDVAFLQCAFPTRAQCPAIRPGEGAQIFAESDESARPYMELEFTGPRHRPTDGRSPLLVTWELVEKKAIDQSRSRPWPIQ